MPTLNLTIPIVTATAMLKTSQYKETIVKVLQSPDGDRIVKTNYIVTLYDRGGIIHTTTTSNTVDFTI